MAGRALTVVFGDARRGPQNTPVFLGMCADLRKVNDMERAVDLSQMWHSNSARDRSAAYRRFEAVKRAYIGIFARYDITQTEMRAWKAHVVAVRTPILNQSIAEMVQQSLVRQIVALRIGQMIRDAVDREIRQMPPWELEKLRLRFAPKHR
jgi:hypothetical protein